jgi:hypothetical protein
LSDLLDFESDTGVDILENRLTNKLFVLVEG